MTRSLVRIGLALTLAVAATSWGQAQHTRVTEFNADFGNTLSLRNDHWNYPYVTEKIVGWANFAYGSTSGLYLQVLYPGGSRYVVTDFSDIVPAGGSYFPAAVKLPCDPVGTAQPVQVDPPTFLLDTDFNGHVVQLPNPTRTFRVSAINREYTWELVDPQKPELGYSWKRGADFSYSAIGEDEVKYVELVVTFTTVETEAIGATVYLAYDAPRGVNPIGQVPSVGKVTRTGNGWTITPVPVDEHGGGGLANASYQLQPTTKPKRPGYHNCNLGWYSMPFLLTLTER